MSWFKPLAIAFVILTQILSLGVPVLVIIFWLTRSPEKIDWLITFHATLDTILVATPTALTATAISLPLIILYTRYPGWLSYFTYQLAYFGYALSSLPFVLAMVFVSLSLFPFLYQTWPMLIITSSLHLMAIGFGALRTRLMQIGTKLEETARSLRYNAKSVFFMITLPLITNSVISSFVMVFMAAAKELVITLLLAPTGIQTMAIATFSRVSEGALIDAAPYAAFNTIFSGLLIGFVLRYDQCNTLIKEVQ